MLGDGELVGGAVSSDFCMSVLAVVETAERKSAPLLDGLVLLLLAIALEGALAFPALVSGGGALTALGLDASSTAVRAPVITSLSRPPFGLATPTGVGVPDPVTAAGGASEAMFSEGLLVWLSSSAPPITVTVIAPSATPK